MKKGVLLHFLILTFTLSGTIMGAGILGLPYVFAQSGFLIGLFWLAFFGIITCLVHLYIGEITLRTKKFHHLTGYTEFYLGKKAKYIMFFATIFGIFSALLAYMMGIGQSLSYLLTGSVGKVIPFGIVFWIIISLLIKAGHKEFRRVELWGVDGIILVIFILLIIYLPGIKTENLTYISPKNFFIPLGVTLFAMLGFSAIPEVKRIENSERFMKKAIILGTVIPIIVYFLFTLVFVGFFGQSVSQIATLSLGKTVIILGILTMLTSYFALSYAFLDTLRFDFNMKRNKAWLITSLAPLILFLVIAGLNLLNFVQILGIAGVVSGGLCGIMAMLVNKKAKEKGNRKPEYSIKINKWIIILFAIIFIGGVIAEVFLI